MLDLSLLLCPNNAIRTENLILTILLSFLRYLSQFSSYKWALSILLHANINFADQPTYPRSLIRTFVICFWKVIFKKCTNKTQQKKNKSKQKTFYVLNYNILTFLLELRRLVWITPKTNFIATRPMCKFPISQQIRRQEKSCNLRIGIIHLSLTSSSCV